MTIISFPNIPNEAYDLMGTSSIDTTRENFINSGKAKRIALLTFGLYITHISRNDEEIGEVVYWGNGTVTVSKIENDESLLMAVENNSNPPTPAECVELFDKLYVLKV